MHFEADLSTLDTMFRNTPLQGPDTVLEPRKEHKDMNSDEYEFYQEELEEQKRQIRNGYQRTILVQLSPSAPNSIIVIALGTRLCM